MAHKTNKIKVLRMKDSDCKKLFKHIKDNDTYKIAG